MRGWIQTGADERHFSRDKRPEITAENRWEIISIADVHNDFHYTGVDVKKHSQTLHNPTIRANPFD